MIDFLITVLIAMTIVLIDNDLCRENIIRVATITTGVYLLEFFLKRGKRLISYIRNHFDKS